LEVTKTILFSLLVVVSGFAGVLNDTTQMQYDPGDANSTWASTTFGEFKRMMGDFHSPQSVPYGTLRVSG
jgi:hypothetical protein